MTDDVVDLEAQWVKRELEKTYHRASALMDEVDADDYEAVCLFESDVEAFCDQYGREPKETSRMAGMAQGSPQGGAPVTAGCNAQAGLICLGQSRPT